MMIRGEVSDTDEKLFMPKYGHQMLWSFVFLTTHKLLQELKGKPWP